jgi:hypothetical protein
VSSLCELRRLQKVEGKSLGMIRVGGVTGFRTVEADEEKFRQADEIHEYAVSPDLFNEQKLEVEALPFKFLYSFRCTDPDCRGLAEATTAPFWIGRPTLSTGGWLAGGEKRRPSRR